MHRFFLHLVIYHDIHHYLSICHNQARTSEGKNVKKRVTLSERTRVCIDIPSTWGRVFFVRDTRMTASLF